MQRMLFSRMKGSFTRAFTQSTFPLFSGLPAAIPTSKLRGYANSLTRLVSGTARSRALRPIRPLLEIAVHWKRRMHECHCIYCNIHVGCERQSLVAARCQIVLHSHIVLSKIYARRCIFDKLIFARMCNIFYFVA